MSQRWYVLRSKPRKEHVRVLVSMLQEQREIPLEIGVRQIRKAYRDIKRSIVRELEKYTDHPTRSADLNLVGQSKAWCA